MTLKLIDKEITGQSTAQLVTQQLGALLKADFDNQYNLYGHNDKYNDGKRPNKIGFNLQ